MRYFGLILIIRRKQKKSFDSGFNCVKYPHFLWFHQDFAVDAAKLLEPDNFQVMEDLYSACTVINIYVGFDDKNPKVMDYRRGLIHTQK